MDARGTRFVPSSAGTAGYSSHDGTITAERARSIMQISQSTSAEIVAVILGMVTDRIEEAAQRGDSFIIFSVPPMLFGYGNYDPAELGAIVARELHRRGFSVTGFPDNFRIAWGRTDPAPQPAAKYSSLQAPLDFTQQAPRPPKVTVPRIKLGSASRLGDRLSERPRW
jgi:hypothetical protein